MKREQVLNKAQNYLIKYSNSKSKYYNELKKNYNEYKSLESTDPVMNKLYQTQILKLCRYVEEKENFWFITISLSIMIIIVVLVVSYATVKILNSQEKVEVVIQKANSEVNINVSASTKGFVLHYANEENFMDIQPIQIQVNPTSKDNYNIIYYVYMVLDESNEASLNDIKYAVTSGDTTKVYSLGESEKVIEKYQLYSRTTKMNATDVTYLRVFTTKPELDSTDFNFNLKYDGFYE